MITFCLALNRLAANYSSTRGMKKESYRIFFKIKTEKEKKKKNESFSVFHKVKRTRIFN